MGEKIKDITTLHLINTDFVLELNEPLGLGRERQIHIQNDNVRFECSESDMRQIAANIIKAKYKLQEIKGGEDETLF
jgi:hypothetical protein